MTHSRLRQVTQGVTDPRLEKLYFYQDHLVIQPLQFLQERVDEGQGVMIHFVVQI